MGPVQGILDCWDIVLSLLKHAPSLTNNIFTLYLSYCSYSFLAISSASRLSCSRISLILLASEILFSSCRRRCISSYLPYSILHIFMRTSSPFIFLSAGSHPSANSLHSASFSITIFLSPSRIYPFPSSFISWISIPLSTRFCLSPSSSSFATILAYAVMFGSWRATSPGSFG